MRACKHWLPSSLRRPLSPESLMLLLGSAGCRSLSFAHQALPHLALVATAEPRHGHHKEHHSQSCTQPHAPYFGGPRLTLSHTLLNPLLGVDFTEHGHAHLFTHLVIDIHFASSVHRKLPVFLLSGSLPDWSFLVFFFPLFGLSDMDCPQGESLHFVNAH